jgi:hypothetical protein
MTTLLRRDLRVRAFAAVVAVLVPFASARAGSIPELDRGAFGYGHLSDSTTIMGGQNFGDSRLGNLLTTNGHVITQTTTITSWD